MIERGVAGTVRPQYRASPGVRGKGIVPQSVLRDTALDRTEARPIFWLDFLASGRHALARRNWSVQDAKNRFSEVVEAARHRPQTVTKHGKPAVVIVAAGEYERLRRLEQIKAPSFAELLLAMPTDGKDFERLEGRLREPGF
jgi:antitoxin Phd